MTIFYAFTIKASDSTNVTLSIQARDVEYISGIIYGQEFYENLTDSIRPAYRKLNNPANTTPVTITGYTKDFVEALKAVRNDVTARANNVDARLFSLLNAINDIYISEILTGFTASDNDQYVSTRKYGKFRITRKK